MPSPNAYIRNSGLAAELAGPQQYGLIVPQGWGANWQKALLNRNTKPAKIVVWGDSIFRGYYCSDMKNTDPVSLLQNNLQKRFGDGGSGYYNTGPNNQTPNAAGVNNLWTFSGVPANWTSQTGGPNEWVSVTTTLNNTATATFRGTSVTLRYVTNGAAFTYGVTIDGVAQANITGPLDSTLHTTTYSGLAPNVTHTIVVTLIAGPAMLLDGIVATNPTGVICESYTLAGRGSAGGSTTAYLGGSTTALYAGFTEAPDVFVYVIGVNDVAAATTADAFTQNVNRSLFAASLSGTTDIIVGIEPYPYANGGALSDTNYYYAKYMECLTGIAQAYNAALINYAGNYQHMSWSNWNAQGLYGVTGGSTGAAGTNGVHPSNAGCQVYAEPLIQLLNDVPVTVVA